MNQLQQYGSKNNKQPPVHKRNDYGKTVNLIRQADKYEKKVSLFWNCVFYRPYPEPKSNPPIWNLP